MHNNQSNENNLLRDWVATHKPDRATTVDISRWIRAVSYASHAIGIVEELEAWLADRSGKEPDLVQGIGYYGWARIAIRGWKKLPIDIAKSELEHWRSRGYEPTIEDVQKYLASVAGGFLEAAGHDPGAVIQLIKRQVAEKTQRMESLVVKPLDDRTGSVESADGGDWEHWFIGSLEEVSLRREPFNLREQLHCFELGMEYMRLFCFEEAPELGLPNKGLFAALCDIDLNLLIGRFDAVDVKLKQILEDLAKQNVSLEDDVAPDVFWWWHYRIQRSSERKPHPK